MFNSCRNSAMCFVPLLFGAPAWASSALFALFVARGFFGVLAAASSCGKPLLELEALLFGVGFFFGLGLTPIGPPCGPPWGGTSSGGSSSPSRGRIMDGRSLLAVLFGAALRLFLIYLFCVGSGHEGSLFVSGYTSVGASDADASRLGRFDRDLESAP